VQTKGGSYSCLNSCVVYYFGDGCVMCDGCQSITTNCGIVFVKDGGVGVCSLWALFLKGLIALERVISECFDL
jgi:hypothetical protein